MLEAEKRKSANRRDERGRRAYLLQLFLHCDEGGALLSKRTSDIYRWAALELC
jgi:hypothetical protein